MGQDSVRVVGQVLHEDDISGVVISVRGDSSILAAYQTDSQGRFEFQLGYEQQYTVHFSKENYLPKSVAVDTRIPEDLDPVLEQLVLIRLELVENISGYEHPDKPLGRIYFSRITEEFTYETRYSGNRTTNFEVAGTDIRISPFIRENDATAAEFEEEEEEIKIRIDQNESHSRQKPEFIEQKPDPEWKLRFYHTIVSKRNQFLGDNPDSVHLHEDLPVLEDLGQRLSFDTATSHYTRQGMTVTEVIINGNKRLNVFHRVRHRWGAVFYFRNYRPVSRSIYKQGTLPSDRHQVMNP